VIGLIERGQIDNRFVNSALSGPDHKTLLSLKTLQARVAYLAHLEQHSVKTGQAIGRITIPRIGASYEVVQGTDTSSLQKGPGHYPATSFPGLGQTVAIAGHRTTYLAPFRHIDALGPGDQIVLKMPYGQFYYRIQSRKIVVPTALWVTKNVGYDRLVLSACNPLYSAAQRIIIFARLREFIPLGAAAVAPARGARSASAGGVRPA
jgi:sortase A